MKEGPETKLVYIEQSGQRDVGFYRTGRFEVPADWTEEKVREMAHTLLDEATVAWLLAEEVEPGSVDHATVDELDPLSVGEKHGSLDPDDESLIYLVRTNGDEIEIL
jgi:hypothetical protein